MESVTGLYQVCLEQLEVQYTGFSQTVLLPIKHFIPTQILNTKTTMYDLSEDIISPKNKRIDPSAKVSVLTAANAVLHQHMKVIFKIIKE